MRRIHRASHGSAGACGTRYARRVIREAPVFSDLHLGWAVCERSHRRLLACLPAAAGDAELIVLNGDLVDGHRGATDGELVEQLRAQCAVWRREGRSVVVVEGNHDPAPGPFGPASWQHVFDTPDGRVLVLHGHRFADAFAYGSYERWGRHALAIENRLLASSRRLRAAYPYSLGWVVGAWGYVEDRLWRPKFPAQVTPLLDGIDVLVHGHFHFGPARTTIAGRPAWKSGAWVAAGHLGTVDRMLRYRAGRWERIGRKGDRWQAIDDGR